MSECLLSLKNLSFGYEHHVIGKNINLDIEAGDFVAIVGSNGSGKSTLIRTILGLLPPLSGKVIFTNQLKSSQIGYLPQETRIDSNFPATVSEIVLSGTLGQLGFKPFYGKKEHKRANAAMKTLSIEKIAKKSFSELSGGQKQKVLLARALAATSNLLILDEPSNNLDYNSRHDFYQALTLLNHSHGLTILMITHDLDADDLIGNKVLSLKDGTATIYNTTDYLQHYHPTHEILDHKEAQ
ncbi:ABC transporter ATP-binding protein [Candidatus Saccharibacteria bacterium]|nr:ABC transporter ATP-binding protein [Candidatus Saccharibacteria bacterium]